MAKLETQQTLWCLPYDSDSVFKPFLKVPFSTYLNNIISNRYFTQYQAQMAEQLANRSEWNQKSWRLIEFFQFLNQNFDMDKWDSYVSFIQDNTLRSTMGFFRLWIDTQRLYMMNFLKLDSNQFQQDRIYMSLYRTLAFFNSLFSEYTMKDFDINFLNSFIKKCTANLRSLEAVSTNQANELIQHIIQLLNNIKKKEKYLVDPKTLHLIKKSAIIKIGKEGEIIKEVQNRLMNSVGHKKKMDEQIRLRMICKQGFIQDYTKGLRVEYDPIAKIKQSVVEDIFGSPEQKQKKKQQDIAEKISNYKKTARKPEVTEGSTYEELDRQGRNPYQIQNYQIYGEATKVNIENRARYQKEKQAEVVSVEDYDRSKFYYDDKFIDDVQKADKSGGKVTLKDLNLNNKQAKKTQQLKTNQDQNTRVFNLKWHQDPSSARRQTQYQNPQFTKNYDNNLLFKSPLQEQMLQNKKNSLDKLRQNLGVKTYTVAFYQQMADQLHPELYPSSFGVDVFVKKNLQVLDIKNFKLIDQNKFDFMRKVVTYMAAQKKIKNLLLETNLPQYYPRNFQNVKQEFYNPCLTTQKVKFAMGKISNRPEMFI